MVGPRASPTVATPITDRRRRRPRQDTAADRRPSTVPQEPHGRRQGDDGPRGPRGAAPAAARSGDDDVGRRGRAPGRRPAARRRSAQPPWRTPPRRRRAPPSRPARRGRRSGSGPPGVPCSPATPDGPGPLAETGRRHARPGRPDGGTRPVELVLDAGRPVRRRSGPATPADTSGGAGRARPDRPASSRHPPATAEAGRPDVGDPPQVGHGLGERRRPGRRDPVGPAAASAARGSMRPRSSRREMAPYRAPGPIRTPAKSSMSLTRAWPCFGPEARLVRIRRGGSLGLRSPGRAVGGHGATLLRPT